MARKAIVRVRRAAPRRFLRSRAVVAVLVGMVIRRNQGRVIDEDSNVGVAYGVGVGLVR